MWRFILHQVRWSISHKWRALRWHISTISHQKEAKNSRTHFPPGIYAIKNMLSSQCVKFILFRSNAYLRHLHIFHVFTAFSYSTKLNSATDSFLWLIRGAKINSVLLNAMWWTDCQIYHIQVSTNIQNSWFTSHSMKFTIVILFDFSTCVVILQRTWLLTKAYDTINALCLYLRN